MQNKKKNAISWYLAAVTSIAALFAMDQFTKHLAVQHLKGSSSFVLIPGVLEFSYLENRGMAFGLLQNQIWLFAVLTILFFVAIRFVFCRIPKTKYYLPAFLVLVVLSAGALGNFYDRLVHHYVIDFIYVSLIHFPVFNVADIYVTVSVLVFLLLYLFYYKEGDFSFLEFRKG